MKEVIGTIMTNHGMTKEEMIELIGGEILSECVQDNGDVLLNENYYWLENFETVTNEDGNTDLVY